MSVDFKVIQEIEVLREFSSGILADIDRYMKTCHSKAVNIEIIKNMIAAIYRDIYSVSSMEQAWLVRGKLQIVNEILKQLSYQSEGSEVSEYFSEKQFIVAANEIKGILTTDCIPQNLPKAYILGGQPGAGKSAIISVVMNEVFHGNAVVVSGDDFRNWHPNYQTLKEIYGSKYIDKTAKFSGRMTEYLIEKCSDQKFNLIIEGTLRTAEVPLQTERLLKSKGYETELAVMAVNPQLSYFGTITRYKKMLDFGAVARVTTKEHHDKVINSIVANIEAITEAHQFDNITLYNRQGICLYSQESTPQEVLQKELAASFQKMKL